MPDVKDHAHWDDTKKRWIWPDGHETTGITVEPPFDPYENKADSGPGPTPKETTKANQPKTNSTPKEYQPRTDKLGTDYKKMVTTAARVVSESFNNTDHRARVFQQVEFAYLWLLKGDGRAAIFLTYCLYWSGKSNALPYGSFYKSYPDIQQELAIPKQGVLSAVKNIQRLLPGTLDVDQMPHRQHLVTTYTVHYDTLLAYLKNGSAGLRPDEGTHASQVFEQMVRKSAQNQGEDGDQGE